MKIATKAIFLLLLSLNLFACAKPTKGPIQSFVPQSELELVASTREGIALLVRRRFLESAAVLYRVDWLHPNVNPVRINLAIALRELGAIDASKEILDSVLENDATNVSALTAEAGALLNDNNSSGAISLFEKAIAIELKKTRYTEAVAISLAAAEQFDARRMRETALCFAQQASGIQMTPIAMAKVGRLLLSDHRYSQVKDLIEISALGGRGNIELQLLHALALLGSGDVSKALKISERLMLIAKRKPEFLPEIQTTRLSALLISLAEEQKKDPSLELLDEESQELFLNSFMGQANQSELARFWPPKMRAVLKLQRIDEDTDIT